MINYYQPYLKPFLRDTRYKLPSEINQQYFHSWEDALWELLRQKNIPLGSTLLFPDFYCMDVLENVTIHGYKWQLYSLDEHFQTTPRKLQKSIEEFNPKIIILFHACGITSHLLQHVTWINNLDPNTIIIEDCVHRLINPEKITLRSTNHFVIDSLRKVSPLPGSFIYGNCSQLPSTLINTKRFSFYTLSSHLIFKLFRTVFLVAQLINSSSLAALAHKIILKAHDDIIGNSWHSYAGDPRYISQHQRIDFQKVESMKKSQVELYERLLNPIYQSINFYKISIPTEDFGELHVYPIGLKMKNPNNLVKYLSRHNIGVIIKFPDSPWSMGRNVLFLPLGFHISKTEIEKIATKIISYSKEI